MKQDGLSVLHVDAQPWRKSHPHHVLLHAAMLIKSVTHLVLPLSQEAKGPGCGTRSANQTAVADVASEGLRLRSELQRAIDEERYADAAEVRDRLKVVQGQSEEAQSEAENATSSARKYELGQRVKHAKLGYDGVVCG